MKILCLVTLLLCAFAQGANLEHQNLPPGSSVEKGLEDTHLKLNLQSSGSAVTEDDLLLMSELEAFEREFGRNVVADAIANMLEGFRDIIINGNDDVPPLDPLVVDHLGPYDVDASGVLVTANINDLRMEGLRWYVVDEVSFNVLRLSFGVHVTIPWITTTGRYDALGRIGPLTHGAGGNFRIFAHRIEFGMEMRMGTNIFGGGHLILRELDIKIDIHDTQIQIHGMTGSTVLNSIINSFVQSFTQDLIQTEMENVSRLISEELFDVINDVLKDYTINDILGL